MGKWRLREAYSDEELAVMYAVPHDHRIQAAGDDHELRVAKTVELIRSIGPVQSAADLSCGNGFLLDAVDAPGKYYGDFAPGWPIQGPIEQTISNLPSVDLFLCCETIEHLDDPQEVLLAIRARAAQLILSTPLNEREDDNPEHYWGWDIDGIRKMLEEAEWAPREIAITHPTLPGYQFQIWRCD